MSLKAISWHASRLSTTKQTVGDKAVFPVFQTAQSPWNRPYRLICQLFLQPMGNQVCFSWRGVVKRIELEMVMNSFQKQLCQTRKHLAYDPGLFPSIGTCDIAGL